MVPLGYDQQNTPMRCQDFQINDEKNVNFKPWMII